MIEHQFDTENAILRIWPKAGLQESDFEALAAVVDPYLAGTGDLAGLIIEAPIFPGWESFGALTAHLRFVRDHHRRIRKVALVTDSVMGTVAEKLASHFVSAEIRQFAFTDAAEASTWILEPANGI